MNVFATEVKKLVLHVKFCMFAKCLSLLSDWTIKLMNLNQIYSVK